MRVQVSQGARRRGERNTRKTHLRRTSARIGLLISRTPCEAWRAMRIQVSQGAQEAGERETHVRTEAPDFVWRAARRQSIQRRLCSRSEGASRMAAQPPKVHGLIRDRVCLRRG